MTIFIHAERYQWHNDDPDYDGARTLSRLNTTHILTQGYASLRCAWILGCPEEIRPYIDAGKSSVPPKAGEVYKQSFEQLFPGVVVPRVVGTACCAQLAASKEAILSRSKEDYERYRRWIIETDIRDDLSGRVLEYAWHSKFFSNTQTRPFLDAGSLLISCSHFWQGIGVLPKRCRLLL